MKNYIVRKILNDSDIERINSIIPNLEWHDGLKSTFNSSKNIKNNLESESDEINKIIMSSIDRDALFYTYTVPKKSIKSIVSKMQIGNFYNLHEDSYKLGHFSTTVFLNNKNHYDGGELCLLINNEEKKFKLDCGYAITYPTGTLHRVNKVTNGERIVSVFWTESLLSDDYIRNLYIEASRLRGLLGKYNNENYDDLEKSYNNPHVIINCICNSILRKYSNN